MAFEPLGADGVKVSLKLAFEFKSKLLDQTFGRVFSVAADTMVDAFSARSQNVMGKVRVSIAIATPTDQREIEWMPLRVQPFKRC